MSVAENLSDQDAVALPDQLDLFDQAVSAAMSFYDKALAVGRANLVSEGRINSARLDADQHAAHGLAWLACFKCALCLDASEAY